VGVPTDPAHTVYTNCIYPQTRPIFDMKRRWFSEVISIDKPYSEILSTFGKDSVYKSSQYSATLPNSVIQPMIDAQGTTYGGGVIRIVFRVKTNANFADETNTGGSFASTQQGAARIDQVDITGCTPAFATSGFETVGEINNTIEGANTASPGPNVGEGYALGHWHATGKPPKLMAADGRYFPRLRSAELRRPVRCVGFARPPVRHQRSGLLVDRPRPLRGRGRRERDSVQGQSGRLHGAGHQSGWFQPDHRPQRLWS
jgi:hypothetical protein